MTRIKKTAAVLLLCLLTAALLSGCYFRISFGLDDVGAGAYQPDELTYDAALVRAVEVYWHSGEAARIESDHAERGAYESGSELQEGAAMRGFPDGKVLRIRFCASAQR